ncbi:hypothetical protein M5689_009721 [Euphorbia peplus]|nr:hypothetical protein M5689_009721 [Euphorbia peplus]
MDKRAIVSCFIIYITIITLTELVFVESAKKKDPCWATCGTVCAIYKPEASEEDCKKECTHTCKSDDHNVMENCQPICEKSCKEFNPKFTDETCKEECEDIC